MALLFEALLISSSAPSPLNRHYKSIPRWLICFSNSFAWTNVNRCGEQNKSFKVVNIWWYTHTHTYTLTMVRKSISSPKITVDTTLPVSFSLISFNLSTHPKKKTQHTRHTKYYICVCRLPFDYPRFSIPSLMNTHTHEHHPVPPALQDRAEYFVYIAYNVCRSISDIFTSITIIKTHTHTNTTTKDDIPRETNKTSHNYQHI